MITFDLGAVFGRFQPFHLGHLDYVLLALDRCKNLIIAVTNPDPWQSTRENVDERRGSDAANPCTFYERLLMVRGSLFDVGVDEKRLTIVPAPICFPERLLYYISQQATCFLTIYDDWGEVKKKRLADLGLSVEVLARARQRGIVGHDVRQAITKGQEWEHLVPEFSANFIQSHGIDKRIKQLGLYEMSANDAG